MRQTLSALVVCVLSVPASAQITTFMDRVQWTSAAGSQTLLENFEGFADNTSFRSTPLMIAAGLGTLSREGVDRGPTFHLIDVPPYGPIDPGTSSGSAFAFLLTDAAEAGSTPGTQVRLAFSTPIRAFGLDVYLGSTSEGLTIEIIGAANQVLGTLAPSNGGGSGVAFAGFVSSEVVSSLRFRSTTTVIGSTGEAFGIDNLEGSPIPAPAAGGLLLLGLALGRRRRAR